MSNLPMKKTAPSRKIRVLHRRSSPTGVQAELTLPQVSKPFEDVSFQAVYQRITNEMRINIIPNKKRERYIVEQISNTNVESKRSNTEAIEESHDRRIYYSVERSRNNPLTGLKNGKPPESQRRTRSTVKFVNRLRRSDCIAPLKESESHPLHQLIVSEMQLSADFSFLADLVNHFKRFDSILNQLKQFTSIESLLNSIRKYILDDEDSTMSQFHLLFTSETNRQLAKTFLFLERVSVLVVVEELIRRKLQFEVGQLRHLLSLIHQTYLEMFSTIQRCQPAFLLDSSCLDWVQNIASIHAQHSTSFFSHNESIHRRLLALLRHTKDFLQYVQTQQLNVGQIGTNMAFYKLLEFYSLHLASVLPVPNPLVGFLATCPSPYLHHTASKEYTLVLDLDETLMHYNYRNNLGQFKIRPYCQEFIFEMSEHFEVGIFTCGTQDYADWVTSHLRGIEFKLYRHHAVQTSTGFIKDLKRLGRDLKKTIILDNLAHNFQLQKENGIEIVGWFGDTKDTALLDVLELLKFVIVERPEDVREGLRLAAQKISASNSLKYHS